MGKELTVPVAFTSLALFALVVSIFIHRSLEMLTPFPLACSNVDVTYVDYKFTTELVLRSTRLATSLY